MKSRCARGTGFARATARIHGTGRRLDDWSGWVEAAAGERLEVGTRAAAAVEYARAARHVTDHRAPRGALDTLKVDAPHL